MTTVQDIPHGEHELTVTHEEYAEHTDSITVDEEEAEATIELEPGDESTTQAGIIAWVQLVPRTYGFLVVLTDHTPMDRLCL